jgi:uncharacterized protein
MQCPVCKETPLVMTERQGIEIDYSPQCRGVWLDRGELDKLIEKSLASATPAVVKQTQHTQPAYDTRYDPRHSGHHDKESHYRKKQKSWLSEFFD